MKLFFVFALLFSSSAFAGSNTSTIQCKSDSGRTEFYAESWDLFSEVSVIRFTIDGQTLEFNKGGILYQYEDGVISATGANDQYRTVSFWGLPSTLKITSKSNPLDVKFRAKVQGNDPRNPDEWSKLILLNCQLYYSI
jgi:hypothetical protein